MDNVHVIKSKIISSPHGFSTRTGGVSTGIYESLNLGMNRGDDKELVTENWDRFLDSCSIEEKAFVCGSQIHSNIVAIVQKSDARFAYDKYTESHVLSRKKQGLLFSNDNLIEADGYVTNVPGVPLAIFTADCTPLLMEDPVNKVIAAVHCGWRGTAADIMKNAVDAMLSLGASLNEIKAAIGPAICKNCFEVGSEVVSEMNKLVNQDITSSSLAIINPNNKDKYLLDLKGVVRLRLTQIGLTPENIDDVNECTMCKPDLYWSHRITGFNRGSQANVIMLKN